MYTFVYDHLQCCKHIVCAHQSSHVHTHTSTPLCATWWSFFCRLLVSLCPALWLYTKAQSTSTRWYRSPWRNPLSLSGNWWGWGYIIIDNTVWLLCSVIISIQIIHHICIAMCLYLISYSGVSEVWWGGEEEIHWLLWSKAIEHWLKYCSKQYFWMSSHSWCIQRYLDFYCNVQCKFWSTGNWMISTPNKCMQLHVHQHYHCSN